MVISGCLSELVNIAFYCTFTFVCSFIMKQAMDLGENNKHFLTASQPCDEKGAHVTETLHAIKIY